MLARLGKRVGALLRKAAQALEGEPAGKSATTAQRNQTLDMDLSGMDLHDAPEHWIRMLRDGGMEPAMSHDSTNVAPWSPSWGPPPEGPVGADIGADNPSQQVGGSAGPSRDDVSRPPDPVLAPPDGSGGARRWADKSQSVRLNLSRRAAAPEAGEAGKLKRPAGQTDTASGKGQIGKTAADAHVHRPPAAETITESRHPDGHSHSVARAVDPARFGFPDHKTVTAASPPAVQDTPGKPPAARPQLGQKHKAQHESGTTGEPSDLRQGAAEPDARFRKVRSRKQRRQRISRPGLNQYPSEAGASPGQRGGQGQGRAVRQNGPAETRPQEHAKAQGQARTNIQTLVQNQPRATSTGQKSDTASQSPWPELNHAFPAPITVMAPPADAPALERSLARAHRLRAEQAEV